jgi:hypothetical protein
MHILFGEESLSALGETLSQETGEDGWYCVPSAIGDVIHTLREEIRRHVRDTAAARRMEHRLLMLESLTAAQLRGQKFWSGAFE